MKIFEAKIITSKKNKYKPINEQTQKPKMNTATLEKMRKMKLFGMHRTFKTSIESGKTEDYTADEMVSSLIQSEWDDRKNRSVERQLKNAKFRYKASIEDFHFNNDRNVDRNQIMRFGDCSFINKFENILITGSTGTGKSYIASAIGHQACGLGFKVLYWNASKLMAKLKQAKGDGSYIKEVAKIERQNLLILDDFGLLPFDAQGRAMLMEIIEDRHGKNSTIVISQVPVNKWYEIIGEQTIADAILDRIVHGAHRLELKGESMRKKKLVETEKIKSSGSPKMLVQV
jgi:DNA replication protein DnaC